jgi:hypothetical protein
MKIHFPAQHFSTQQSYVSFDYRFERTIWLTLDSKILRKAKRIIAEVMFGSTLTFGKAGFVEKEKAHMYFDTCGLGISQLYLIKIRSVLRIG